MWSVATYYARKWRYEDKADWDCYATEKYYPNETEGKNMTAAFCRALYVEYVLCWTALGCQIFHLLSKFLDLAAFRVIVGWIEMFFYLLAFAWLIWATIMRFGLEGRVCAGSTNNITFEVEPFAYN